MYKNKNLKRQNTGWSPIWDTAVGCEREKLGVCPQMEEPTLYMSIATIHSQEKTAFWLLGICLRQALDTASAFRCLANLDPR